MMIQIKSRILDAIYRHAISAYPSECCGIITGKKDDPSNLNTSFPCRNIQDEMHASDPQKFPRTSQTAYFLDPKDLFNIEKMARAKNEVIRIIYHSHVDAGSYFSDEDKKQATFESGPLMPDVNYLVVDVTKKSIRDAKLFGWNSQNKVWEALVFSVSR